MWASQNGHVEMVDMLLQHGAMVDMQDEVKLKQVNHQLLVLFLDCILGSNLPVCQLPLKTFQQG